MKRRTISIQQLARFFATDRQTYILLLLHLYYKPIIDKYFKFILRLRDLYKTPPLLIEQKIYYLFCFILDDYDVSSKSGTPSPMISRVGAAHLSATDLRDLREPSAARSLREGSTPRSLREGSAGTVASDGSGSLAAEFGGGDGGFDGAHGGKSSNGGSSLGTR